MEKFKIVDVHIVDHLYSQKKNLIGKICFSTEPYVKIADIHGVWYVRGNFELEDGTSYTFYAVGVEPIKEQRNTLSVKW